jgi:chemotaxis protein methyltransferase CheR
MPRAVAALLYQQGRYAEASDTLLDSLTVHGTPDPPAFSLLARALANQGKLSDALAWCDRWIAAAKLDCSGHYLRAVVLQELGDHEQARHSLQRAIYLQPRFVLGHFALGTLARVSGKSGGADKHFARALNLLRRCPPDELLPECDGLTAGRLAEIITSLLARNGTP